MANPNTALRYIVKNPPVESRQFMHWADASVFADEQRLAGRKVKITQRYNGKHPVTKKVSRVYVVHVYEVAK